MAQEVKPVEAAELAVAEGASAQVSTLDEHNEIIRMILARGGKRTNGVVISNLTPTPQSKYVRIGLTLDRNMDYIGQDETTGEWVHQPRNLIFTSNFVLAAIAKLNDDIAAFGNGIADEENAKALVALFSRAKVDIVQETIPMGVEYHNPFSSKKDPVKFQHDTVVSYVVNIRELGKTGQKLLDMSLAEMAKSFFK